MKAETVDLVVDDAHGVSVGEFRRKLERGHVHARDVRWPTAGGPPGERGSLPVLVEGDNSDGQARGTIQGTWDLSLDSLAGDGRPQARPLLLLFSCYAPATPIPAVLLKLEQVFGL